MKNISTKWIYTIAIFALLSACTAGSKSDLMKLIEERDSLRLAAEIQNQRFLNIEKAVQMMNSTMDSIAMEENMIFVNVDGKDGVPVTRQDALSNLERFEDMMKRQHQKIEELQEELKRNVFNAEAQQLVDNLQSQIAVKDRQIAELRKELEKKDANIAELREQVRTQSVRISQQSETITQLNTKTQKQGEALQRQDAALNTAYVLIATKSDLKDKGVISKKGVLNATNMLDKTKFQSVDIRVFKEISFSGKKAKILTNMPEGSFSLYKSGENFQLIVSNPTDFWRISNYLVIQTD